MAKRKSSKKNRSAAKGRKAAATSTFSRGLTAVTRMGTMAAGKARTGALKTAGSAAGVATRVLGLIAGETDDLPIKATKLLEKQHGEVSALFARIEKAEEGAAKRALFNELAANLFAHDAIERQIFYPACEKAMGDKDLLGEALVEHGLVEFTLFNADRERGKRFDARLKVLKDIVEHHVEEEEKEFFPKAEKAIGGKKLEELGARMRTAFEAAKEKDWRGPLGRNVRQVVRGAVKTRAAAGDRVRGAKSMKRAA